MGANARRVAAGYLALQAIAAVAWWLSLFTMPEVRRHFELSPERPAALDAFLVADMVIFVGGSGLSSWLLWRRSPRARTVVAFTAGGVAYATLYLVAWVAFERTAAVGLVPMVVALVATTAIAVGTDTEPSRVSGPDR